MKKILLCFLFCFTLGINTPAQKHLSCEQFAVFNKNSTPDLGIVIYSNDVETVWNAFRLATYAQGKGDTVVIFLLGKGLDGFRVKDSTFNLAPLKDTFVGNGGQIIACASCAKVRGTDEIAMCTIASLADLYAIIKKSKKVITF
jgi:uncharacterized protein involved in oxidation of intracellular sulfur